MGVSGWMLLGLEKGVKVPERILDEIVGRHLTETHLEENLSVFCSDFQERMKMSRLRLNSERVEIVRFKVGGFPISARNHFRRQIRFALVDLQREVFSFAAPIRF